ncbi:hypothetical protein DFJ58DRAFT_728584 [Suillus subalutaceus]|uniref:uncharacterized protein n=1 Tax=Suillus subalutaceus TaxID=48586 RepID=UPI001B8810FD|nr:uncharacterized protein DFJ58DRAFT_728584 [Suillus subalutaceus]KAG1852269.1 hypothetical protein DFJ58DRAFT_728584 [Suillus subalutaceus]
MAELSDDELEKAKDTAEEWSSNFPPPEIQAQVARKKGPAYMEHFSKEMWRAMRDESVCDVGRDESVLYARPRLVVGWKGQEDLQKD